MPLSLLCLLASTVLMDWSLEDVAARADRIVIGQVDRVQTVTVEGRPMKETRVRVRRTLKGAPAPDLVLSQIGGMQNGVVTEVVGDATLPPGAEVLLFTYAHPDGRRYLVGMSLGAYYVAPGGFTQDVEVPLATPKGLRAPPGRRVVSLADVERAIAGRR